jgi:hypothetical protein
MLINASITPELDGAEPRRSELRIGTGADVSLRKFGSTAVEARLLNISSRGFKAESDAEIPVGNRVWLTVGGLPRINALVVWAKGCRFGGEFAEPVDPLQLLEAAGGRGGGKACVE